MPYHRLTPSPWNQYHSMGKHPALMLDVKAKRYPAEERGKRMSQQLGNDSKLDNAVMTAVAPLLE